MDLNRQKIQLYCNQVFVTDNLEGVVPEFLALLQGVIDSPDIPLNVSRSALQSDSNVKKISAHISKKVSDRLHEMFKNDRADFEKKSGRQTNNNSQQRFFSTDVGMDFSSQTVLDIKWGRA